MSDMISKFSTRTEYSKMNRNVRSTMNETIEAFEQVANFFIDLLNNGKKSMKGVEREIHILVPNGILTLSNREKGRQIRTPDPES